MLNQIKISEKYNQFLNVHFSTVHLSKMMHIFLIFFLRQKRREKINQFIVLPPPPPPPKKIYIFHSLSQKKTPFLELSLFSIFFKLSKIFITDAPIASMKILRTPSKLRCCFDLLGLIKEYPKISSIL